MKHYDTKECTGKCHSEQHASDLIGLISKTSDPQTLLSGMLQCCNPQKVHDDSGRYIIHMAASCGRSELLEWLVQFKKADMNLKTLENGWTAAHCSAFHGHLDSLITLIKLGANLIKNDYDRLTPFEHLGLDKWHVMENQPILNDDSDIYSWGSNENFNLGIGHDMKKQTAEVSEFFKKTDISISQVVMSKFHTVFLSKNGLVYTCGFGIDGRLGHGDELTLIAPKLVEAVKHLKCIQVAASRDNSYFLMSDGVLYGCGTNVFKQLGQLNSEKALSPIVIHLGKRFKTRTVKQIECSKFHCILLTGNNEVFTFGLNAGQLGHPNEMVENQKNYNHSICLISEPRSITALNEPDLKIDLIACSEACTVALQHSKNILYVFSGYKCRRLFYITQTNSPFKKIRVQGGKLDNTVHPDLNWIENRADPLLIVGLTESNSLFIWREIDPIWRKITWSSNKKILVADFDLNLQGIILCTIQGVCYKAQFPKVKIPKSMSNHHISSTQSPVVEHKESSSKHSPTSDSKVVTEVLELSQIPFVNRCFHVVCDKKARNFFALQHHPAANLRYYPILQKSVFPQDMDIYLGENIEKQSDGVDSYGYIDPFASQKSHDIELKYNGRTFCLNKFVLSSRCAKFFLKLNTEGNKTFEFDIESYISRRYSIQSIELMMWYVYTGRCSAEIIRTTLKDGKITQEASFIKFLAEFKELAVDKFGMVELKKSFDQNIFVKVIKEANLNNKSQDDRLETMSKLMEKLISDPRYRKKLTFSRNSHKDLHDCEIRCNNNETIKCHKTILVARCEYFQNMLLGCWVESNQQTIELPFDVDLMQIIVDYLYTDDIQMDFIHESENCNSSVKGKTEREIEVLFNLFVLSDQLLLDRLKNLCEFKLANLVNLKNVVEIFEFAAEYEAEQLKEFAMEFIICNLITLLEAKLLESMSIELLRDLSKFYRSYYPLVGSRIITPYSFGLDPNKVELIPLELLNDQKFVDIEEEYTSNKKKSFNAREINDSNRESPQKELPLPVVKETENLIEKKSLSSSFRENIEKWEMVKKKNRRKNSEKDLQFTEIPTSQTLKQSPSFPSESMHLNTPKSLQDKQEQPDWPSLSEVQKEPENNWPSLSDMTVIKKKEQSSSLIYEKKKLPKNKFNSKQTTPKIEKAMTTGPAWGGMGVSNENPIVTPSAKPSLMDVMNEEMKSLSVQSTESQLKENTPVKNSFKKGKTKFSPLTTSSNENKAFKGWNITNNETSFNPLPCSIANIIEMEKRSKAQYKKLTNRPLNAIQLEEAAIECLQRYYDVENQFDITIKIELLDEADFKDCAPIWKNV